MDEEILSDDEQRSSAEEASNGDEDRDTDVSDAAMLAMTSSSQQVHEQLNAVAAKHQARGDEAAQYKEWEVAVREYTTALRYAVGPQEECALLSKRSEALCKLCRHIRSIPARTSERRALYGQDPTQMAQLALKDAEKGTQLQPTNALLYARQGSALLLLERFSDAESAFLEGLALQPANEILQAGLKQVQAILAEQEIEQQQLLAEVRRTAVAAAAAAPTAAESNAAATAAAVATAAGINSQQGGAQGSGSSSSPKRPERPEAPTAAAGSGTTPKRQRRLTRLASMSDHDDFECILCLKLLYEPVTTPCGHTFCRGCFARSMDHGNRCPMCRTVLHVGQELPITITLQNIISKAFPAEWAARVQEAAAAAAGPAAAAAGVIERVTLPLFVMSTLLPGERMALNIFEPRYRLMVRRCMEGNRRFGMAQTGRTGPDGLDELAVEAEITDCQPQPDGRYYIEMIARRRIKLNEWWELDGYRVASAQLLRDVPLPDSSCDSSAAASGAAVTAATVAANVDTTAQGSASPGSSSANATGGVSELVDAVVEQCDGVMNRLRGIMTSRRVPAGHIRELFDRVGDRPSKTDPEAISWWAARLLLFIPPPNAESCMRRELLAVTSTKQRLEMLHEKLDVRLNAAGVGSCAIM